MMGLFLAIIDDPSDRERFMELYEQYGNAMLIMASKILGRRTLAEEAVQESFIKIARNIDKTEGISARTTSFITIIVRNTCYDILRNENRHDSVPFDDSADNEVSVELPDIQEIVCGGGLSLVRECIEELSDIYRDAISLRCVYGYSVPEIADILGVSVKTAETRLYRAKKELKNKLEENGYAVE